MKTREEIIEKHNHLFAGRYGYPNCGKGWLPLVESFCDAVNNDVEYNNMPPVKIECIKEKFGTLQIYYTGGDERTRAYSMFANRVSDKTCETCGTVHNVGKTLGWIKTICKDCNDEWAKSEAGRIRSPREWLDLNEFEVKKYLK